MAMVRERNGVLEVRLRCEPGRGRDEILGERQGKLQVRVAAPPVNNCANQALCRLLALRLNLPITAVKMVAGARSRNKRVEIRGVSLEQLRALLDCG